MFLTRERAKAKLWLIGRGVLCALALLVLGGQPSQSRADMLDWLTNLVQDDDMEHAALSGVTLPPDAIVTRRGETRMIELGRDLIELYPSTAVTFDVSGGRTTVHLISGTIRAKVAKRKQGQTFDVKTPMLVGTVKGTDFEVSAIGGASAVSVYEGRVAVKAVGRVGGIDVTPGKTASVRSADRDPSLGKTPTGGAAAAAKALARGTAAKSGGAPTDDGNKGTDRTRAVNTTGRSGNSSSGSDGGTDGDGEGGESGGDREGGESGDGDSGEGGDGEGGEGGEGGDDDD
jgi:hypothetical protein